MEGMTTATLGVLTTAHVVSENIGSHKASLFGRESFLFKQNRGYDAHVAHVVDHGAHDVNHHEDDDQHYHDDHGDC